MQRDVECVVDGGAGAFDADVGGDRLRTPEQDQRLIEQVRAQVEPKTGAGLRLLAPRARPELRAETVKVGFERGDAAKHTVRQQFPQGYEVSHVTAVAVGRE